MSRIPSTPARGTPWCHDGNVRIVSSGGDVWFQAHMSVLSLYSVWFDERLSNLSDDTVEVIDGLPVIPMDSEDSPQDLSSFLQAIYDMRDFQSLTSLQDFVPLSGILRLATKYGAGNLRARALTIFHAGYPTTLAKFDRLLQAEASEPADWVCDPILILNLARETSAFSLLPAAMAFLANDSSAGEVFGVQLHDRTPCRIPHHALNATDVQSFALVKELSHGCVVQTIKFLRDVAAECCEPPEVNMRCRRMAPVGYKSLLQNYSVCAKTLHKVADDLTPQLLSENPVGYLNFMHAVQRVTLPKTEICRRCRFNFESGVQDRKKQWWDKLPYALGFQGWGDDRMQ